MMDMQVVDSEDVPVILLNDGSEQVRRVVTTQRCGASHFSFHTVHFDGGLVKEMYTESEHQTRDVEIVLFVIQGSATLTWDDHSVVVRPGMAICINPRQAYKQVTGPLGLTVAVAMSPPKE